jgi:hypothetical protein
VKTVSRVSPLYDMEKEKKGKKEKGKKKVDIFF